MLSLNMWLNYYNALEKHSLLLQPPPGIFPRFPSAEHHGRELGATGVRPVEEKTLGHSLTHVTMYRKIKTSMPVFPVFFFFFCMLDQPQPLIHTSPVILFISSLLTFTLATLARNERQSDSNMICRKSWVHRFLWLPTCTNALTDVYSPRLLDCSFQGILQKLCVHRRLSRSALLTRRQVRCGWFSCWMCFPLLWQPKSPYRALSLLIGALSFEMLIMISPRAYA